MSSANTKSKQLEPAWMRAFTVVLRTIAALLGISALLIGGTCALFSHNVCSDDLLREETSPDGAYVAATFQRNCGATTRYVYHVNLRRASDFWDWRWDGTVRDGEVFASADDSGTFDWISARQLQILDGSETATNPQKQWGDVQINYAPPFLEKNVN